MLPSGDHDIEGCAPARDVISRIGERWSMLIIIVLGDGSLRFNALKHTINGISQRMLSLTLKNLERDGLVARTVTPSVPPRVDYQLTTLGLSLWKPVRELGQWAIANYEQIEQARSGFDKIATPARLGSEAQLDASLDGSRPGQGRDPLQTRPMLRAVRRS